MNKIEIISAKNPRCRESEPGVITLDVRFSNLPSEVPFTACHNDCEEHGRELYSRAMFGEFGPIEVIPPPTELEIAAEVNPGKLRREMDECFQKTQYWDMFGETEKAQAWRDYFKALAQLKGSKEWPIVKEWPERPESEQEVE